MTAPSDLDRFPTLTEAGRAMLQRLREHPSAPRFRNQSGNRLTAAEVEQVLAFEARTLGAPVPSPGEAPTTWLKEHVERCYRDVPYYRAMGGAPRRLRDVPTVTRAELSQDIARFVPDTAPLDRLMHFSTSGTTGHPLLIASHPVVAARYLTFHKRALRRFGVTLRASTGDVGVALLGYQRRCFTYASVTPTLGESGLVKLNLHPDDWRAPEDRRKYLEDLAPEILSGDPLSLTALLELGARLTPRAILSTSMALPAGLSAELSQRFACPVVDLYSLNEAGPVAAFDPALGGHVLLQPELMVELLDAEGQVVAPGERGEITLTGGFNFCLPLLRYRTGDYAALAAGLAEPTLLGLEGRPPVRFRTPAGAWLNNIEITHALKGLPLRQYQLHQAASGVLTLSVLGSAEARAGALAALRALFGPAQAIALTELVPGEGKITQYSTELTDS